VAEAGAEASPAVQEPHTDFTDFPISQILNGLRRLIPQPPPNTP
jgi:hypothetical protein